MTEIREAGFSIDLPGEWEPWEATEPGSFRYRDTAGTGTLTVMLLSVRPSFAIADRTRLHSDYMHHRQGFERGKRAQLEQSEPVAHPLDESVEGMWTAFDPASGRRQRHRVIMVGDILADFAFEEADGEGFEAHADTVLGSALA